MIFHYVTEFNRKVIEEKEMTFSPALVPYKIWRKLYKLEKEKNKKMVANFLEIKTDYVLTVQPPAASLFLIISPSR